MERSRDIFNAYKLIATNSREAFLDTPENVRRWQRYLDYHNSMKAFEAWRPIEMKAWRKIAESRRPASFLDMPEHARAIYQKIADAYFGRKVYACGSYVSGEWITEKTSQHIKAAKKAAYGVVKTSDFDYWSDGEPSWPVPLVADKVRALQNLMLLPMWDFKKLPASEYANAIQLVNNQDYAGLIKLHDQYKLSPFTYCCNSRAVLLWFQWGIENGKIIDNGNTANG